MPRINRQWVTTVQFEDLLARRDSSVQDDEFIDGEPPEISPIGIDGVLSGADTLPGFTLAVRDIFSNSPAPR